MVWAKFVAWCSIKYFFKANLFFSFIKTISIYKLKFQSWQVGKEKGLIYDNNLKILIQLTIQSKDIFLSNTIFLNPNCILIVVSLPDLDYKLDNK